MAIAAKLYGITTTTINDHWSIRKTYMLTLLAVTSSSPLFEWDFLKNRLLIFEMQNSTETPNRPQRMTLSGDDIFAGLFLILFSLVGVILYATIFIAMISLAKKTVGFRFLLSQAIADMHIMLQFGVLPGIIILLKKSFIPTSFDWWLHMYMDGVWWAMCYHFILIAWSRFVAIWRPFYFRALKTSFCYCLCLAMWMAGFLQSVIFHQFRWFAIFWFDPASYGMTADWAKYSNDGTKIYYLISNGFFIVAPAPLYACACGVLWRQKRASLRNVQGEGTQRRSNAAGNHEQQRNGERQMRAENRLLIPCAINSLLFAFGQIVINMGVADGKWIGWSVMVVFSANSFVNPVLLLAFSSVVRKQLWAFVKKSGSVFPSSNNALLERSRISSILPHTPAKW